MPGDNMYPFEIISDYDDYLGIDTAQCLIDKTSDSMIMRLSRLNECPEDAYVDCYTLIDFIKIGMRIAQAGYDGIQVQDKVKDKE